MTSAPNVGLQSAGIGTMLHSHIPSEHGVAMRQVEQMLLQDEGLRQLLEQHLRAQQLPSVFAPQPLLSPSLPQIPPPLPLTRPPLPQTQQVPLLEQQALLHMQMEAALDALQLRAPSSS